MQHSTFFRDFSMTLQLPALIRVISDIKINKIVEVSKVNNVRFISITGSLMQIYYYCLIGDKGNSFY
jgi:hypothetical protein